MWLMVVFFFSFFLLVCFFHPTGAVSMDLLKNVLLLCWLVVFQFCSCWDRVSFSFFKISDIKFCYIVSSIWAKQETELNIKTILYLVDHCATEMSSNGEQPCFLSSEDSKRVLNPQQVEVWRLTGIHTVALDSCIWLQTCNSKNQIGLLTCFMLSTSVNA